MLANFAFYFMRKVYNDRLEQKLLSYMSNNVDDDDRVANVLRLKNSAFWCVQILVLAGSLVWLTDFIDVYTASTETQAGRMSSEFELYLILWFLSLPCILLVSCAAGCVISYVVVLSRAFDNFVILVLTGNVRIRH